MLRLAKRSFITVSALIMLIALLILQTSCIPLKRHYNQDVSEIKSIEIVDATYNYKDMDGVHKVLYTIDDVDKFLTELNDLTYRAPISAPPHGIDSRTLAVKITYNNLDYEIFDSTNKSSKEYGSAHESLQVTGFYETDDFFGLLLKYLSNVEKHEFNYMHPTSEIKKIEIVKGHTQDNTITYASLFAVEDNEAFINRLNAIRYTYENEEISEGVWETKAIKSGVRITYKNGDYEIFSHNHRDESQFIDDGNEHLTEGVYIGTFNSSEFYSLLSSYMDYSFEVEE